MTAFAVQLDQAATSLIQSVVGQFYNRTVIEGRRTGKELGGIKLDVSVDKDSVLWLNFTNGVESHSVTFPMPFSRGGVQLICQNEVLRAISPFWFHNAGLEIGYYGAMYNIILGDCTGIVAPELAKRSPYLQQMIYGFCNGNAAVIANRFQRAINDVVHRMPLHETDLNSWIMNNRLMIVDPAFDELRSPTEKLNYQVAKARAYFDRGWTSIGLSDGVLAEKNYILKSDLRKLTPFGLRFHNPQRNLFSTLGMKGSELPLIRSRSMQDLMDKGVSRGGWNLTTAFMDIPDVFEDQIMIGAHLVERLAVKYERRFQVFGDMLVSEGEHLRFGQPFGTSPAGETKRFSVRADDAVVKKIARTEVSVGGNPTKVYNVVVEYYRQARDGFKITNLHGNKGVVRVKELGYAVHPITGKKVQLDVIVAAKTVGKRKNFGQVLEALLSNLLSLRENPLEPIVLEDDWCKSINDLKAELVSAGFREDCTWDCHTYAGAGTAVVGKVFWGCIKTPEDQIWEPADLTSRNCCDLRTKGLKFSHVEMRALETRLGEDNPVIEELLTYVQGTENLSELIVAARAKTGVLPSNLPVLDVRNVRPVDQSSGTIVPGQFIEKTVVDEFFMPDGFVMKIPFAFQTLLDREGEVLFEGSPMATIDGPAADAVAERYVTDHLYIPSGTLRKCWQHDTGLYGLSEVGVLVNNVVAMSQRLLANAEEPVNHRLYYNSIQSFFDRVASMLCSKRGEISTLGMAVRYPFSVKAVACLTNSLPKNTVEIHRELAQILRVSDGDIVIGERFPCLGFMSMRLQRVKITDNPMCRYTIRASGNSLVSTNLDHDGDVFYLAAFHSPEAKAALRREFENPNQTCYSEICKLNERKGAPHVKCYTVNDFNITPFIDLTNQQHAEIVGKNTGVKAQTGPVIALTYNLMRIVENSDLAHSQKMRVAIEMFLEKAAQSVFEQKHGGKSLYEIVIDSVCLCDVETLVAVGFKRSTTERLCALIRTKAAQLGVFDLTGFHQKALRFGGSNIISKIVREQNRIYFASRSKMEAIALLKALEQPAVDIPSKVFRWVYSGKAATIQTEMDKFTSEKGTNTIKSDGVKDACTQLMSLMDELCKAAPQTDILGPLQVNVARSLDEILREVGDSLLHTSAERGLVCR